MRELKFRAWVNGHWTDFIPTCKTLDAYNASIIDTDGYTFDKDNPFIVEQYTGIKDKNGKEIYEGDILGVYHEYCDKDGDKTWEELEPWGTVIYEDNKAMFGVWADSPFSGEDKHFFELGEGLEVIGNIHENKGGEE